jgi:hypothetical protein
VTPACHCEERTTVTGSTSGLSYASATADKRKITGCVRRRNKQYSQGTLWISAPLVDRRSLATCARLAFFPLSTFPQPRSSTAPQRLTSHFTETIHNLMHRTLALHPRGWRDRSMLSCWPWVSQQSAFVAWVRARRRLGTAVADGERDGVAPAAVGGENAGVTGLDVAGRVEGVGRGGCLIITFTEVISAQ